VQARYSANETRDLRKRGGPVSQGFFHMKLVLSIVRNRVWGRVFRQEFLKAAAVDAAGRAGEEDKSGCRPGQMRAQQLQHLTPCPPFRPGFSRRASYDPRTGAPKQRPGPSLIARRLGECGHRAGELLRQLLRIGPAKMRGRGIPEPDLRKLSIKGAAQA